MDTFFTCKSFLDRLYAISKDDMYPHKNTVLLMTVESDAPNAFDMPQAYYNFITTALGWTNLGTHLVCGCHGHNLSLDLSKQAYKSAKEILKQA